MKGLMNFLRDENGQGMVEYGLIIGLIAVAAIIALSALGPKIGNLFSGVSDKIPTVN